MNILCPSMIVFPPFLLSAAGYYFRIWTGQVPALSIKKYNIANSSSHFGSYGRSFGPYNSFLVTDRSIYCHMTLSSMNYLLYINNYYLEKVEVLVILFSLYGFF